jgi:H+-transporting ATPase
MQETPSNCAAGLTSAEASSRRARYGPNTLADAAGHPLRRAIGKLWAPVPWMLEAAIVLQLALGKEVEAAIIAALLLFNAVLGYVQEGRAQATLAALKSRLALTAIVRRDGAWATVPAADLVPGDLMKLSLGAVVSADGRLTDGSIQVDQSMLTGESVPVEAGAGVEVCAGALVQRGEATAEVTATGARTRFGRAAELVRTAHVVSSQQEAVLHTVRNLALFNGAIIVLLTIYAHFTGLPVAEIITLVLTAVLASIPVALPATFTLASALGARSLARLDVLPTRLSAVDEAASMDVLCSDKTGTLTRNALTVAKVQPMPGFDEAQVLMLASLASSDGGRDPVDAAVRGAAAGRPSRDPLTLLAFSPFDPDRKYSAATTKGSGGDVQRIVKGACPVVAALAAALPAAATAADELERQGFRVLAVAVGPDGMLRMAGLIALSDPPRADSAALVSELRALGVRTVMVTGDAAATAANVAHAVGLDGGPCPPGALPADLKPDSYAVFAGVSPEDKFRIVRAFQASGHVVGMCGDGANDAPALRQAQFGIAVSTATDVAKSAAGMVLTAPGLGGIVAAVREGRITFQRILTYTLNSVTKKVVQVLFLGAGLLMTGHAILTPALMVVVMITGDFLGMAITTDNVRASARPNSWHIGRLTAAGVVMGIGELLFCGLIVTIGYYSLGLSLESIRTLAFVTLVFGNQATTYNNRERRRLWASRPSNWLLVSSAADILIASTLAIAGIAMTPLPAIDVAQVLAMAIVFTLLMDFIKVPVFRRLQIA